MNRIQGQLSRPHCTKAPKQNKKYRKVHGPCATRTLQRTLPPTAGLPAIASDESCITSDHEHLLCTKSLTQAADDEAAEDPSAGDAPRAALPLDRASPSAADGCRREDELDPLTLQPRTQTALHLRRQEPPRTHPVARTPVQDPNSSDRTSMWSSTAPK